MQEILNHSHNTSMRFVSFLGALVIALLVFNSSTVGQGYGSVSDSAELALDLFNSHSSLLNDALALKTVPTITIDLLKTVGTIDPRAFGITVENIRQDNTNAGYFYRTAQGLAKLQELGVTSLFYSTDYNDWSNQYDDATAAPLSYPAKLNTPEFLSLNAGLRSEPVIAANVTQLCHQANATQPASTYNVACVTASASLAADWVRYINSQSVGTPKVRYVALGVDPLWGCSPWNSPLGINCLNRAGLHQTELNQAQYVSRIKSWAQAIKVVDPSIKIGVHLQPNTFICQASCSGISWDQQVLQQATQYIDFVIVHQYFLVSQPASNAATATKYSYYQKQIDVRVLRGGGVTAMPSKIRSELAKWVPAKKTIPIFAVEFNASRIENVDFDTGLQVRSSLYGGIALGELLLDLLRPVTIGGVRLPGAQRAYLHHLYNSGMLIARNVPIDQPEQTMLFTPSWYILSALKDFGGKTFINPILTGNPMTSVGLPALRAYAVKSGKDVWLAVFNHSPSKSITADIHLKGTSPKQVLVIEVGKDAASLLAQNTLTDPNAVTPLTTTVPGTMLKPWGIQGFTFSSHNLAVLHIVGN